MFSLMLLLHNLLEFERSEIQRQASEFCQGQWIYELVPAAFLIEIGSIVKHLEWTYEIFALWVSKFKPLG